MGDTKGHLYCTESEIRESIMTNEEETFIKKGYKNNNKAVDHITCEDQTQRIME